MVVETTEEQDLAMLRRKAALLRRQKEIHDKFGLLYYSPHIKQEQFHRAGGYKKRMVRAGNRFGKSECGSAEDSSHFLGYRPFFPEGDPDRTKGIKQGPSKGLVVTTDWDKVDEIFTGQGASGRTGKLWQMIPHEMVKKTRKNHSGVIDYIEGVDEQGYTKIIRFDTVKSFKQNPMGSESSEWDWVHWDEPAPQPMHKAVTRGLMDNDGSEWFTLTPLTEPWINDLFFPTAQAARQDGFEQTSASGRQQKLVITGSIYDNPHITEAAIAEFKATLTEDEIQCRINGLPLHLSGLIFKEFDPDVHVLKEVPIGWTDYNNPPAGWPIYYAIDPHPRTPHAVLFLTVSPQGQIFVYDELFIALTIDLLSPMIRERIHNRFVVQAKLDPSAYIKDPITGTDIAFEFAKNGLHNLTKGSKDLANGLLKVKRYLKNAQGNTPIYISPMLRTFLWEINRYVWDDKNGIPTNTPKDIDDHMMENFRRLLFIDPRYTVDTSHQHNPCDEVMITDAQFGGFDDLGDMSLDAI